LAIISRLMLTVSFCPKVITLSAFYCTVLSYYYGKPSDIMYITNGSRQTLYLFIENNKELTKKSIVI
jgi:hypothetical protein